MLWCVEAAFDKVDGVTETISGYAGGTTPNPTYGAHEGYYEALKVTYDPAKVTYATLLDHFWHNIDPFDTYGQFCDKGSAYRRVVFVGDDEEKALAETTKEEIADRFKQDGRDRDPSGDDLHCRRGLSPGFHNQNPVGYKYYKWGCGRAQRLEEIWGAELAASKSPRGA